MVWIVLENLNVIAMNVLGNCTCVVADCDYRTPLVETNLGSGTGIVDTGETLLGTVCCFASDDYETVSVDGAVERTYLKCIEEESVGPDNVSYSLLEAYEIHCKNLQPRWKLGSYSWRQQPYHKDCGHTHLLVGKDVYHTNGGDDQHCP